jgi:threonine aldolase
MARYDFASDNTAPVAPEAMAGFARVNSGFAAGYGADEHSRAAADLVRAFLDADAEVRFVASGTAANAVALAALCQPFEAVLAHDHAHVRTDETGAPGLFGHGLGLTPLAGASGRIDPASLAEAMAVGEASNRQPATALSLSNATEYGSVYATEALSALSGAAKAKGLGVHLDGARLANAAASGFDVKAIAGAGVDILVLGGTKAGMPPTEALVVFDRALARRLDQRLKQAGQLPSKGRYYAAPFIGMLEEGAILRHAAHANAMTRKLAEAQPFRVTHPVEANALFVEMDQARLDAVTAKGWAVYRFLDGSVRFMCSWATTPESVEALAADLKAVA